MDIKRVKSLIYDTLTLASQPKTSLDQSMDLSLSPAMQKRGVNIIQIQSVTSNEITMNLIQVLKELDSVATEPSDITQIVEVIKATSLPLQEFIALARQVYVSYAVRNSGTKTEAARRLRIQRTYLSRITNKGGRC